MISCVHLLLLLGGDGSFAAHAEEHSPEVKHIQLTNSTPFSWVFKNLSLYTEKNSYIWHVTSPTNSVITVRRSVRLGLGDVLKIYDHDNSSLSLPNYRQKFTSPSNSITLELTPHPNKPNTLTNSSIIAFNLSLEVHGFCSHERTRCDPPDSGFCYQAEDRCDGVWDCPNGGADEIACSFCPSGYYPCETDSRPMASRSYSSLLYPKCYPSSGRCDGKRNCFNDGVDELDCTRETCSLDKQRFLCDSSGTELARGQCIPLNNVCNSVIDCANGADEASALCIRSVPDNSTAPEVARLIAHLVSRRALEDCLGTAAGHVDAQLRTTLTYALSALIGSLLTVCAIGFVCRTQAAATARRTRISGRRVARFNSPILRLLREEIRRRPPPPTYSEAMNNSLFEEPILEGVPEPPLVVGPLTRDQVVSVRERSMKIMDRVDVACSCHLPTPPPSESSTPLPPSEPSTAPVEAEHVMTGGSGYRRTAFGHFLRALRRRGLGYREYEVAPTYSEVTTIHDDEMHPSPSTTGSGRYSVNSTAEHPDLTSTLNVEEEEEEEELDENVNGSLAETAITTLAQISIEIEDDEGGDSNTHPHTPTTPLLSQSSFDLPQLQSTL